MKRVLLDGARHRSFMGGALTRATDRTVESGCPLRWERPVVPLTAPPFSSGRCRSLSQSALRVSGRARVVALLPAYVVLPRTAAARGHGGSAPLSYRFGSCMPVDNPNRYDTPCIGYGVSRYRFGLICCHERRSDHGRACAHRDAPPPNDSGTARRSARHFAGGGRSQALRCSELDARRADCRRTALGGGRGIFDARRRLCPRHGGARSVGRDDYPPVGIYGLPVVGIPVAQTVRKLQIRRLGVRVPSGAHCVETVKGLVIGVIRTRPCLVPEDIPRRLGIPGAFHAGKRGRIALAATPVEKTGLDPLDCARRDGGRKCR